jgi:hypothetical protein
MSIGFNFLGSCKRKNKQKKQTRKQTNKGKSYQLSKEDRICQYGYKDEKGERERKDDEGQ